MKNGDVVYNEKLGVYQKKTGNRMRRVEQRTCIICGDKYWHTLDYPDRGNTCGKSRCVTLARLKTRHRKLRGE